MKRYRKTNRNELLKHPVVVNLRKMVAPTCRSTLHQFLDYAFCVRPRRHAAVDSAGWVSHATLTVSKMVKEK